MKKKKKKNQTLCTVLLNSISQVVEHSVKYSYWGQYPAGHDTTSARASTMHFI